MKKLILPLFFLLLFGFPLSVKAVYDPKPIPNNKFGIHILYPEEIFLAAKLVNTNGGDWGYVTIPIQATDRDLEKWQVFMDNARNLHLIPIIRLSTYPINDYWAKPDKYESADFANFLNSLNWPTRNRYVIIFNEVNRAQEWGGELSPEDYARYLNDSIDIFKAKSPDFFILNAGLDAAAPNNHVLMSEYSYLDRMEDAVPGILSRLDGWNSHSYPNPGFSSLPFENRRNTVYAYKWEENYLSWYYGVKNKPVFITETGWSSDNVSPDKISDYYETAFNNAWSNIDIVAVTPFLLSAGAGPFRSFSFTDNNGQPSVIFRKYALLKKIPGQPVLSDPVSASVLSPEVFPNLKSPSSPVLPQTPVLPLLLENMFKWIFYQ